PPDAVQHRSPPWDIRWKSVNVLIRKGRPWISTCWGRSNCGPRPAGPIWERHASTTSSRSSPPRPAGWYRSARSSSGSGDRTRLTWSREYLDAALLWARAALGAGYGGAAIGPLAELADQHPLNESLAAALMRALHAAGRGSEALKLYTDTQARLANELGTDPGAELQAVHRGILRGRPVSPAAGTVPAQLPADPASFAGRRPYLAQLD